MKKLLPFLLLAILATAARADLTITQKIEQVTPSATPPAMTLTLKIKGQKVLMDMNPKVGTIMDLKTGDIQTLMHEKKMVMTMPGSMIKGLREKMETAVGTKEPSEPPKPTGRKETITGFACEEYEATVDGTKIKMWLTKDLPAAEKAMLELSALSPEADPLRGMMKDQKISGFPMRTVIDMGSGGTTTATVVALSEAELPESEFVVPSDYKPMQMPTLPGQ